jgi:hypothetical protein
MTVLIVISAKGVISISPLLQRLKSCSLAHGLARKRKRPVSCKTGRCSGWDIAQKFVVTRISARAKLMRGVSHVLRLGGVVVMRRLRERHCRSGNRSNDKDCKHFLQNIVHGTNLMGESFDGFKRY